MIYMENTYLFLIWNKALYQRQKILNDINNSFEIVKDIYIKWNKNNFPLNLQAFYGRKLGDPRGKMISSGTNEFELILVKDNNPNIELRNTYDGKSYVNTNIYDKKQLYRSWTCGSHRIHSSDSEEEVKHDLVILFGPNYQEILNNCNDNEILNIDTKGIAGFNNIDDFKESLKLYGNNIVDIKDNNIVIFCNCRYDIVKFLNCTNTNNSNTYTLVINKIKYSLYIFGELDGDLIDYSFNDINNINIKNNIINNLDDFINKKRKYIDVERKETLYNRYVVLKNEIKLLLKKLG